MATILYNDTNFRAMFPAFANTTTYPQATIQQYWNLATSYITDCTRTGYYEGFACVNGTPAQQTNALNLMTAHFLYLNTLIVAGQPTGVLTGATIDKVSVQLQAPPESNQWQWWLNQSPYGQQLLALLQIAAAGGRFFSAGAPVVCSIRGNRW